MCTYKLELLALLMIYFYSVCICTGIVLSWNMSFSQDLHEAISRYQLFAYQETSTAPSPALWKKVDL